MNFLDKVIRVISPATAFKREHARYATDQVAALRKRHFEGAARTDRTAGWKRPNSSGNAALTNSLPMLRNMSRNLTRNNPYAEKALTVLQSNIVGAGINARFRQPGVNDENKAKQAGPLALQKQITSLWWSWAYTTACDTEGLRTLNGIQALVARTVAESGEVLIRRRRTRYEDNKTIPFQLQILEPDFIDGGKNGILPNGNEIVQGIELDATGGRVAYWLYEEHPGDNVISVRGGSYKSNRILARDIIHVFDPKRAGVVRGYPWSAPSMVRMNEFDSYEDAQLVKQRVSAAWCAFIYTDTPPNNATGLDAPNALPHYGFEGGDIGTGQPPQQGDRPVENFQPGVIEYLPNGKKIEFADPPSVTGYGEYSLNVLRAIASGYGITYESLTGDYSNVNFSSGRMGWLEFARNVNRWQQQMMITMFCDRVWGWFSEAAQFLGTDTSETEVKWIAPRREMIDPVKEINATKNAVRAGLISYTRALTEMGQDPEETMEEIAAGQKEIDRLGIYVECDARKPATTQGSPLGTANDNGGSAEK